MIKIFVTKTHGESHPISMHISQLRLFHMNFHVNTLLAKLPNLY